MDLSEKLVWLVLGMSIGFVLGYIVRSLREIREEIHDVDEKITKRAQDERGAVSFEVIRNAALLVVVLVTVWAAFASQSASNEVKDTQDRIDRTTDCNKQFLEKTIVALNERTTYSTQQAKANAELQTAQKRYFVLLLTVPPLSDPELRVALEDYFDALNKYLSLVGLTAGKAATNAYPTAEELASCLAEKK